MELTFDKAQAQLKALGYYLRISNNGRYIDVINVGRHLVVAQIDLTSDNGISPSFSEYKIRTPIAEGLFSKEALSVVNKYVQSGHKGSLKWMRVYYSKITKRKKIWNEQDVSIYCYVKSHQFKNQITKSKNNRKIQDKYEHLYNDIQRLATLVDTEYLKRNHKSRSKLVIYKQSIIDKSVFRFLNSNYESIKKQMMTTLANSNNIGDLEQIFNQIRNNVSEYSRQDYLAHKK